MLEAADTFVDFKEDVAIVCKVVEAIFLDELVRNIGELYAGVFWSVEWGAKVKVGDIKRSKLCSGRGDDAV